MTSAITVALKERLERERRQRGVNAPSPEDARHRRALRQAAARWRVAGRPRRLALRRAGVAKVIVDTSAVMAILFGEIERSVTTRR